jgi:hypothetical protein
MVLLKAKNNKIYKAKMSWKIKIMILRFTVLLLLELP